MDKDQMIIDYALQHKEGILADVDALATEAKTNPILLSFYEEARLDEIRQHIANSTHWSYADVSEAIDADFVESFMGE